MLLFAFRAVNRGRSGDVCMDKKVLPEFLNPDSRQEKGWILILHL